MNRFKVIATLVLAVAVLIVVLQNTAQVETRILFFSVTMPRALLLVVTLLIGFALGVALAGKLSKAKAKAKTTAKAT